ncbi:hypothetical protein [Streptomyces sp. NBC_00670]|uniref:hypothetical protein n=1 Tax=Streptomyces sp. NBC_00670 TaxID=2975804 RepID=UPI002E31CB55|nr:hypothetical protein [Streptomyces sp. NBC_00670]
MKSWRSRIAAAAMVVGAAAAVVPLSAGSAAADSPPANWGYYVVGGTTDYRECERDGLEYLANGYQNYFCWYNDGLWELWVLDIKDQAPTHP